MILQENCSILTVDSVQNNVTQEISKENVNAEYIDVSKRAVNT